MNRHYSFLQVAAVLFLAATTRMEETEAFSFQQPAPRTSRVAGSTSLLRSHKVKKSGMPVDFKLQWEKVERREFLLQALAFSISAAAFVAVPTSPATAAADGTTASTPPKPKPITSLADLEPYEVRQKQLGMASKQQVLDTLNKNNNNPHHVAMILDVRREEEIAKLSLTNRPFVHAACGLKECGELESMAETILPDKKGRLSDISWKSAVTTSL